MFTDTHCHIQKKYYENIDLIIQNANSANITRFIANGTDYSSNCEVLELHKKYPEIIFPAVGFHPECLNDYSHEQLSIIEENITSIVAIGEIGLDYHYEGYDKNKQIALFESQLKLAEKYHKPVIVHTRDALEDTISILKKFPQVKGVIHCFTGSLETAQIFIKMGYKLGFGGVTTFKNAKVKNILKFIPEESILLETDCPYLSPEPLRGTTNEPKNVLLIACFIANELGISLEKLSDITEKNVSSLFDI